MPPPSNSRRSWRSVFTCKQRRSWAVRAARTAAWMSARVVLVVSGACAPPGWDQGKALPVSLEAVNAISTPDFLGQNRCFCVTTTGRPSWARDWLSLASHFLISSGDLPVLLNLSMRFRDSPSLSNNCMTCSAALSSLVSAHHVEPFEESRAEAFVFTLRGRRRKQKKGGLALLFPISPSFHFVLCFPQLRVWVLSV